MPTNHERVLEAWERVAAERRGRSVPGSFAGHRRDTVRFVRRAIARQRAQARSTAAR